MRKEEEEPVKQQRTEKPSKKDDGEDEPKVSKRVNFNELKAAATVGDEVYEG